MEGDRFWIYFEASRICWQVRFGRVRGRNREDDSFVFVLSPDIEFRSGI
jgi:hypothetical protein